jgi:probable addiction module antidote protein
MLEAEPFDAARYLGDPASRRELLAEALESGETAHAAPVLGVIARAKGMTEVAREAGITHEALYRSLAADGDPRLSTLLGLTLEVKLATTPP